MLYIFWFLHQTTTSPCLLNFFYRCISFDSYIKPQLNVNSVITHSVVYLLIPTSNHNRVSLLPLLALLYIFWFLHQTTTTSYIPKVLPSLYIFWFLHQTTTVCLPKIKSPLLYIFWFLHQTTTRAYGAAVGKGCISFDSYIKPQLWLLAILTDHVVYLLIPTSNHNNNHYCM